MAVVRLSAAGFALQTTLERIPEVEFEVERVVAHETGKVMPYIWATADPEHADDLRAALEDDPTTGGVELLVEADGEWLYRMEWVGQTQFVVHILVDEKGTIVGATGKEGEWRLQIMFPDRDSLGETYDFCEVNDIPIEIEQIYRMDQSPRRGQYSLTEEQYETLVAAFERGYYDIPRGISGDQLSDELGISHQALSERLRRAYKNLISNALVVRDDECR
ncbi:helix-turn-helix domain-containing protein [Haladaptatus halobius]|uniref:helix-turn-helix domain-containing protein n=1 Tax=Haladaptatus halobius TaxID=2884875 RepID=UPI0034A20F4E